jgi:lysine biosynthesis protein LysW
MKSVTKIAECPNCGDEINLGLNPSEGQQVVCFGCGEHLEVISLDPPELDWMFSDAEPDWELDVEEWEQEYDVSDNP